MKSTIFLVDDDDAVRTALTEFLTQNGFNVQAFASGSEFLRVCRANDPGCVLLDLKMPGMSGLSVQEELVSHGIDLPIIFMSAYGTVEESVQAMKTGAADFLQKPFSSPVLLERINEALVRDQEAREKHLAQAQARLLYDRLTDREKEILNLVVCGQTSKGIAAALGISPRTVDHHRTSILLKLRVESIAELAALVAAVLGEDRESSKRSS